RDQDEIEDLKERLVFILSCLGLSLTQLLGQNWPSESKEKMDNPADLLSRILRCSHFDRDKKKILNKTFREFFSFYGAIRHFGKVKNDTS
ncbi:MAG: hypothetical protein KAT27_01535, partial [Desulfobacterales bacterium]|nr:hypothetical protein [Desulfobacterales bacterium]